MYQGQFFPIDEHGMVGNPARLELVPPLVLHLIPELNRYYQSLFGESLVSVCLRGSAARGQWVAGVSDLDTVAIVRSEEQIRWQEINGNPFSLSPHLLISVDPAPPARKLRRPQEDRYPFPVEYIRTDWFPNKAEVHPRVAMVLKTQALPVWGEDIREALPPVPLSLELVLERRWVDDDWSAFRQKPTPANQQQLTKTLLRARGGSLLVGEGRFSPDLDLCAAAIRRHKPGLTAVVDRVVSAFLRKQKPDSLTSKALEAIYQLG
jgi:uncharacterized protein